MWNNSIRAQSMITWNSQGSKRDVITAYLQNYQPNVLFLQEGGNLLQWDGMDEPLVQKPIAGTEGSLYYCDYATNNGTYRVTYWRKTLGSGDYQGNIACFVNVNNITGLDYFVIPANTEYYRPIVGHKTNLTINGNNDVYVFSLHAPSSDAAANQVLEFTNSINTQLPGENVFMAGDFNVVPAGLNLTGTWNSIFNPNNPTYVNAVTGVNLTLDYAVANFNTNINVNNIIVGQLANPNDHRSATFPI